MRGAIEFTRYKLIAKLETHIATPKKLKYINREEYRMKPRRVSKDQLTRCDIRDVYCAIRHTQYDIQHMN